MVENQHMKFEVDRIKTVEVVRATNFFPKKLSKNRSSKGNNSAGSGPIKMKIVSRTTAHGGESTYEV